MSQTQEFMDEDPQDLFSGNQQDGEDEQSGQQQEEQEEQQQQPTPLEVDEGVDETKLPGPTQAVAMVYSERELPDAVDGSKFGELRDYDDKLATAAKAGEPEAAAQKAKRDAAAKLSSRVVRRFAVDADEKGEQQIDTDAHAFRFMSFERPDQFVFERAGFMVQGMPSQKQSHVAGEYKKPGPMNYYPRDKMIGGMARLADIDGRPVKKKSFAWSKLQSLQVQGAVSRIDGRVLLGSGALLSINTVVAFPGTCTSETEPIAIDKLDLRPAPFTDLKCYKDAAVLYNEPFDSDYADVATQATKIDQYAVSGWKPNDGDDLGEDTRTDERLGRSFVPRFALVHRVHGTVGEVVARLKAEVAALEADKSERQIAIAGALERIETLTTYFEQDAQIDFYAYQLLDELQVVESNVCGQVMFGSGKLTDDQMQHNIKMLVQNKNTVTYTIDWAYRSRDEPDGVLHRAFAKIALPIVPHAFYTTLYLTYDPDAVPVAATKPAAKKGVKRAAVAAISAKQTEDQVLGPETPARTVRFAEPDDTSASTTAAAPPPTAAPSKYKVSSVAVSKKVAVAVAQPAAAASTPAKPVESSVLAAPPSAVSVFRNLGSANGSSIAMTSQPVLVPLTKPNAAEATKKAPQAPEPSAKKKRTQEPSADAGDEEQVVKTPAVAAATRPSASLATQATSLVQQEQAASGKKKEAPTDKPVAVPERTPVQRALFERLCAILETFKSRDESERFGVWADLAATEVQQYKSEQHPEPPATIHDALIDAATLLNFIAAHDALPRLLEQERAALASPPLVAAVSRRPKLDI